MKWSMVSKLTQISKRRINSSKVLMKAPLLASSRVPLMLQVKKSVALAIIPLSMSVKAR